MKVAVIADIHYGSSLVDDDRRRGIADILLSRVVQRLNGLIKPDLTVVLGDLIDDGNGADARERLLVLRSILDGLDSPWIAIPGNHDCRPEQFFEVFPHPGDYRDVCGVRFVSFVDREEPGYNASRSKADIDRFRKAREDYTGPIVSLQHVCLFPSGKSIAPYNYTNAAEIIAAMRKYDVALSVSGHFHPGAGMVETESSVFINAPGLCTVPFPFLELEFTRERTDVIRHSVEEAGSREDISSIL